MTSPLMLALGPLVAVYAFLSALLHFTQNPKEPPMIETSLPFLSPLLGYVLGMQKFIVKLRDKYNLPMYTLRMPGQRIYIVNSSSLIPPLQRRIKTIAFAPIEAQAAATVMGVGPAGNAIIGSDKMFEHDSYLSTFVPSTHPALSPGAGLDALNCAAACRLSESMHNLSNTRPARVELFSYVRREIFRAITDAIYGPKNPFCNPALEEAWYTFEPDIMTHLVKAWPSLFARKSLHAREHLLIPAFEKYFAENGHHQGSLLVRCRYEHNTGHGLKGRDIAATEIGQMVASLTNSMAGAFWMVYHVFSDPIVLNECRAEVEQLVQVDANGTQTLDIAKLRSLCPILFSTWEETLRYMHIGISARVVMEDVMFDKYLLKKGSTVMTAAAVQNSDTSIWGPTANKFNHRRFLPQSDKKHKRPTAFRPFGGGTVLCPGRHFVSAEVLSFTALLLLHFDLKSVSQDGKWPKPGQNMPMTVTMPTPKDEVQVNLVPRNSPKGRVEISISNNGGAYF
ncbi:hypothetical protein ACJ72_00175 [Emergomyces africanus]|uniref:Cytochrome P450 oxidoreductase n=1 Tax=Emergomyces africanus TaxID=1955775 RepID=A0A1B7P8T7_9EURO|nr:hypothetical protein ACJ72_00175 [Emergomyces africanus]